MRAGEEQLKAWMIAGLAGDARAHADLLRALLPVLRAFLRRRMAGQDDQIEDIVQDVLIAVHTRRASYDRARPFTSWLFAIARYKMIDHFRSNGRTCTIEGLEDILVAEGFAEAADAHQDVARLLDTLPAKQAAAIRATRIEGLSTADAAARAGIGVSDVKVSVHRGLKALAERVRGTLP